MINIFKVFFNKKHPRPDKYTSISNTILQHTGGTNDNLSLEAKGLLCTLLSHTNEFRPISKVLAIHEDLADIATLDHKELKTKKDKQDYKKKLKAHQLRVKKGNPKNIRKIRLAFQELESKGYARMVVTQGGKVWQVTEVKNKFPKNGNIFLTKTAANTKPAKVLNMNEYDNLPEDIDFGLSGETKDKKSG